MVNKPNKMLVYPSLIAKNCHWFATKELAKMGYENLHTVHRLDRPTSGLLLFAKNKEMAKAISTRFADNQISKNYLCIVRGFTEREGSIDKGLQKEGEGEVQEALTHYRRLQQVEVDMEISKYPQSRFSLLEVKPITGRMHQIRRHFAHLRHPIIGDIKYGDRHYNRYMREVLGFENLMLHAFKMEFIHPLSKEKISVSAPLPDEFLALMDRLSFSSGQFPLPPSD